jgi:sulfatase maturation enzyme AslB (radical SAM superfamily)
MVPDKNTFCNTPWYEAHIYWDGSLGICCQESRRLYSEDQQYNISDITLADWFNSEPVRKFRSDVLESGTDICSRCYHEESLNGTSRRIRSNQKSVIFTKTAFADSYHQSPGYDHFLYSSSNQGHTETYPIDLHIDLGNHCNLACKMCWSGASTTIASQYVKWGYDDHKKYLGQDWTRDDMVWNRFLNELLTIPKLKNIHLMGGETLLSPRFEQLVDFMITHQRFELCFSFVTNGTRFNQRLVDKLKKFARVGIEVSIETATEHNDYIRQGTDTRAVLKNIDQYLAHASDSVSVTLRPAISLLSVGYYDTLLEYCWERKLLIKSLIVTTPEYLNPAILPQNIKTFYLKKYQALLEKLPAVDITTDYNESDRYNFLQSVKSQIVQTMSLLESPEPADSAERLKMLTKICTDWDKVYGFDARELYPEFQDIWNCHGY